LKGEWSWTEMQGLLRLKQERQLKATQFTSARPVTWEPNGFRKIVVRDGIIVKT
jgi:hypothetical protein